MTTEQIAEQIRSGVSVTDVAIAVGLTQSAIYLRLRRAGTPVSALTPHVQSREYREIPGFPGYRAGSNGAIQSCVSTRTGDLTEHWRDLATHARPDGSGLFVSLGASTGRQRRRPSLRSLLVAAWGADRGEKIYQRVLRARSTG